MAQISAKEDEERMALDRFREASGLLPGEVTRMNPDPWTMRSVMQAKPSIHPIAAEHFETEVLHQWDFVQRGTALMDGGLRNVDLNTFWFGLHSTVSALGNISKVFFPARRLNQTRCVHMRTAFGVGAASLLGDRKVRNALEHFDERVDNWAATSQRHNFADRNVFAPGAIAGLDPSDFARNYDPTTTVISVFGESVDLKAVIAEVQAIVGRVQGAQRQRHASRYGPRPI